MPVIAKNIILRARRKARFCGRLTQLLSICRRPTPSAGLRGVKPRLSLSSIITIEEVCQRYGLPVDEILSWHNAMQRHGL